MGDDVDVLMRIMKEQGWLCAEFDTCYYAFMNEHHSGRMRVRGTSIEGCMWDDVRSDSRLEASLKHSVPVKFTSEDEERLFAERYDYRQFKVQNTEEGVRSIIRISAEPNRYYSRESHPAPDRNGSSFLHVLPLYTLNAFVRAADDGVDSHMGALGCLVEAMKLATYYLLFRLAQGV